MGGRREEGGGRREEGGGRRKEWEEGVGGRSGREEGGGRREEEGGGGRSKRLGTLPLMAMYVDIPLVLFALFLR